LAEQATLYLGFCRGSNQNEPPPKVAISRRRFTFASPGSPTPAHAAGLTSPPAGVPPASAPATGAPSGTGPATPRLPPNTVLALTHDASSCAFPANRCRFRASIVRTTAASSAASASSCCVAPLCAVRPLLPSSTAASNRSSSSPSCASEGPLYRLAG